MLSFKIKEYNLPFIYKNKPAIAFIVNLIAISGFFLLFKIVYHLISDRGGSFYLFSHGPFNFYETLRGSFIGNTKNILSLFYSDVRVEGWVIRIANSRGISVQTPCLGINVFIVFITLFLAYPAFALSNKKIYVILAGLFLIYALNTARMVILTSLNHYSIRLPIDQHDIFNFVIYSFVFGYFYWWTKKVTRFKQDEA